MSFFVLILPLGGGRTEGSSICLQILAEGPRLRDTAIPEGHRPAALLFCLWAVEEPKVRQFACKFLPRVPACGKRQSPKGADRRHFILPLGGGRTEGSSICLQILAEGPRLRETAIPEGHRPAALLFCLRSTKNRIMQRDNSNVAEGSPKIGRPSFFIIYNVTPVL